MIHLKTPEEIAVMKQCGQKLRSVVTKLIPQIKVGMTTKEIDDLAEKLILSEGAESSFNKVPGYKWSTCLPINEQVVHTPPSSRKLKNGDVLTLDIGAFYKGFHTDYATTFVVGESQDPEVARFLEIGRKALNLAIKQAQNGKHLGDISKAIQETVTGVGYCILKELTGHGIGHDLHEDPYVLGYVDRPIEKTYQIRPGLVIAIEVIYSVSSEKIAYEPPGKWSIVSADKSLTACFEKTIAVEARNTTILT